VYIKNASESGATLIVVNDPKVVFTNAVKSVSPILHEFQSGDRLDVVINNSVVLVGEGQTFQNLSVANFALLSSLSGATNRLRFSTLLHLDVDPTSAISEDGKGYGAEQGPGPGTNRNFYYGSGGGHGGEGGDSPDGVPGGRRYEAALDPLAIGSGGGNGGILGSGGSGGGHIALQVGGELRLAGRISANGQMGVCCSAGGGSGGTIILRAESLLGNGQIVARGGNGHGDAGSGGGGGIINLSFAKREFSGAIDVEGGKAGGGNPGEDGVVLLKLEEQ